MISEIGFDEVYGARPIKRAIQDKLEDFISEEILKGAVIENTKYTLVSENNEVKFKGTKKGNRNKKEGE